MTGEYEYDLVTLGAGSGGVRASRFASSAYGAKVAVIELPFGMVSSDSVGGAGGTCVIRGCVPKKLLVYGSSFSNEFIDAEGFGWKATESQFDWSSLITNKGKEVTRLNGIYGNILKNNGVEHIEGRGYIKDEHTVQVLHPTTREVIRELSTENILIAVGGQPSRLDIPGSELTITSDEALSLSQQPARIAIIGAGYIAVEFAGIFSGIGSKVHLFYRKDLPLTKFDKECREIVQENLSRGMDCYPQTTPLSVEKLVSGEFKFTYKDASGEAASITVDQVMMATGRSPRTANLGLEVFCQPPLGTVGLTEQECIAKYSGDLAVFSTKFKPMKHTLSGRDEKALMKMIVHKASDRVVGVHMVGDVAAEIMQGIGVAMKAGASKSHFDSTIGIHPSSAEEFVTMRIPTRTVKGCGSEVP